MEQEGQYVHLCDCFPALPLLPTQSSFPPASLSLPTAKPGSDSPLYLPNSPYKSNPYEATQVRSAGVSQSTLCIHTARLMAVVTHLDNLELSLRHRSLA